MFICHFESQSGNCLLPTLLGAVHPELDKVKGGGGGGGVRREGGWARSREAGREGETPHGEQMAA